MAPAPPVPIAAVDLHGATFAHGKGLGTRPAAAVASLRARDGVAVPVHTAWGSFWLGWGVMQLLVATGIAAPAVAGTVQTGLAFWFVGLTLITASGMLGALANSPMLFLTLAALTGGAAITAAGWYAGSITVLQVGGWFFVVSAALAWVVATAMMLENAYGRTIIPLGVWKSAGNVPGRQQTRPIAYPAGMPGVRVGQ